MRPAPHCSISVAFIASLGFFLAAGLGACDTAPPDQTARGTDQVTAPSRAAVPAGESSATAPQAASGDGRPSILVVVIDTLRADAVSAYGAVEETTPVFDALAAEGTLYGRAFAPSSWTLPSHATLLTGLGVERHGVGVHGRETLGSSLVTIAERLAEAGYHTMLG